MGWLSALQGSVSCWSRPAAGGRPGEAPSGARPSLSSLSLWSEIPSGDHSPPAWSVVPQTAGGAGVGTGWSEGAIPIQAEVLQKSQE